MNTINIKYCAQDLQFEEDAYKKFETYESQLKEYFLTQVDGSEIFEDLKLRICEMLQSKMKASSSAISETDIADIKKSIGEVNQLENFDEEGDDNFSGYSTTQSESTPKSDFFDPNKKLYRNLSDKILAGVCGGFGNYFSIDPLAFRLLFVLVALMTKGFGILAYIVLWIVLKPKMLPVNLSKRLFRNRTDKVIAGVCGGLASFFKTEAWIVRLIFLSPIILNITMEGFFDFGFTIFNGSAMGFTIIAYIILWMTTKETTTPTEELLSKGEDINISSISAQSEQRYSNPDTNSGINVILRVVAFVIIAVAIIPITGLLISLAFGSVFMLPLTNAVLHTPLLKWLGALSVLFFIILPLVAFIVWAIRRIGGVKGPNKVLRLSFGGLWALGLASAITLSALLLGEMNKKSYVENKVSLPVVGDTLYVGKLDDNMLSSSIVHTKPIISNFYEEEGNERMARLVSFKKRTSPNDSFYVRTKIIALGKGSNGAAKNATVASYRTEFNDNQLFLANYLSVPIDQPFRFQHAEVTIYVPQGKTAIIDDDFDGLHFGNSVIRYDDDNDWDDLSEKDKKEVKKDIEEAMDDVSEAMTDISKDIKEAADEIGSAEINIEEEKKNIKDEFKKAEKRAKANIELEKQKLRLKKEQIKLEKLERELEAAED